jgi:hypothetical protein
VGKLAPDLLGLDGELVVWTGNRLDFDALQQRNANTAATVRRRLAPTQPASFVRSTCWRSATWISGRCAGWPAASGWSY